MARLQKRKQAAVTTGLAGTSRPSPRDGVTVSFVLSLGIGSLAPIARACRHSNDRELDLSVERPGPHDFAVRNGSRSSGTAVTSIATHLNVRDDAYVPLLEAGCREKSMISEKTQQQSRTRRRQASGADAH
ncbi:hypothetical protein HL667_28745 [Bradyrhizobium sp. 83012]|uniref:Uncharacterized protein n=1 Tax=Bradyrhizobium aeschynomenes TaxID=2734909 RepID=A0ABX2CP17_9BRAD|nr:hypothetical protein [Bradyrhizobium aeschynomenes]NPU69022.1 hypothetical protein [Bradyrhizobium aeschynomenes]NPV23777.1 hypothetical protein [Bradyrhizobium aeschynomenes]